MTKTQLKAFQKQCDLQVARLTKYLETGKSRFFFDTRVEDVYDALKFYTKVYKRPERVYSLWWELDFDAQRLIPDQLIESVNKYKK